MGHLLGYARVSTLEQRASLQTDALKAAGCYRIFTDKASGMKEDRPQLAKVLDQLRPGDTLVVWRLDRLGRSLRHLIDTVNGLAGDKIGFRSLTESIDTTTSGGKLVFHIFAALAELERDVIRERTMAGLEAARARGRSGGRPTVMTPDKVARAQKLRRSGDHTMADIARVLEVSRASVYRHLGDPPPGMSDGASKTRAGHPSSSRSSKSSSSRSSSPS